MTRKLVDWRMVLSVTLLLVVAWLLYVGVMGARAAATKDHRVDALVDRQNRLIRVVQIQQQQLIKTRQQLYSCQNRK